MQCELYLPVFAFERLNKEECALRLDLNLGLLCRGKPPSDTASIVAERFTRLQQAKSGDGFPYKFQTLQDSFINHLECADQ